MEDHLSETVPKSERQNKDSIPGLGEIGLNNFAPYLMNRLMARYNANLSEELKQLNITTAKARTLAVLSVASSLTINELSVLAVTEQSTMSRTLDSLEEQGYIRRQPRPEDMRVRDISITESGRAAFVELWPTMYGFLEQMFQNINEDEQRAFTATLQKIMTNVRQNEI